MKNLIRTFAGNRVFANLIMITILAAGILASQVMVREDMPEMELDTLVITVSYPGADPEEIEEGISRKIEDALDGLQGVDELTSTCSEGSSKTVITVTDGYDPDQLLDRVRNEVDSITSFPTDAENPSIYRPQIQKAVISLALVSSMSESRLKEWADQVKKEIQQLQGVSQVQLSGTRAYEISVEISQADLMKYNLTLNEVADIIAKNSLNQSGGTFTTNGQEIRVRTIGRKYTGNELGSIKLISNQNGQTLYLEDLASIKDGFTQNTLSIRANGQPAVLLNVLAGDEDTIDIADRVRRYVEQTDRILPDGSGISILSDNTQSIRSNLDTLFSNAVMGLILVFILLWLFMDTKISFWAGMGIPISLLGGLAVVHFSGITLNKITLFGLIMVLGIVADDAIVVGESVFYHRKNGASPMDAVVKGVSEVGMPVLAAILTTIVAFFPLYHIEGMMGKFIIALPTAVIACLAISLIECMVMLPAHLSDIKDLNQKQESGNSIIAGIKRFHRFTVNSMDWAAGTIYLPVLKKCVQYRYLFVCVCISGLLICSGLVFGGILKFNVFPNQASSILVAAVTFPEGTTFEKTKQAVEKLEKAARAAETKLENKSELPLIKNILSTIGQSAGEKAGGQKKASPNIGGVRVTLLDPDQSGIHSDDFLLAWEEAVGTIPGIQSLDINASNSGPPGAPVQICIQGENLGNMAAAADQVVSGLKAMDGVYRVHTDNAPGKNELTLRLKKEAEYLGLDLSDISSQVYAAYYGAKALKIQRENDEVEVYARSTLDERQTARTIQDFRVKIGTDKWVSLSAIADVSYAPGVSTITRKDGYRQIKVSAKVNTAKIVSGEVIATLQSGLLKTLKTQYPDIRITLDGDAKRQSESFGSLYIWIPISILAMFVIIATMFRSYVQPILVLFIVPFGVVGAVLGHLAMGHMLSLLSIFGMVALTGVVVNDAIVLIERINKNLEQGFDFFEALFQGGKRRFRAVMLTSISTIVGLLPLILETSQYAQQLIPMGISLAFGVAFATVLTLILLPCSLTITNDLRIAAARLSGRSQISRNKLEPAFKRISLPASPGHGVKPANHAI